MVIAISGHPEGIREPALSTAEKDLDSSTSATCRTLFAVAVGQNDGILMEGTYCRMIQEVYHCSFVISTAKHHYRSSSKA